MFPVSSDDRLHQRVTHHIVFTKKMKGNSRRCGQGSDRLDEAARFVLGKIDLSTIPGHDTFRVDTDSCQEHEHLLRRGILSFVENDERLVQCASPHVGERCNLDDIPLDGPLDLILIEHVMEGVVERAEIG